MAPTPAEKFALMFRGIPKTTRCLGQAWCRVGSSTSSNMITMCVNHVMISLCNVHQDMTTGGLTYYPISVDDLPRVTETPAS